MTPASRAASVVGHTPGPWRFLEEGWAESMHGRCEPLTICSRNNVDLAIVFSADDSTVSTTREQAIANARLIATAPTMYEYISERAKAGDASAISILEAIHGHS